MDGAEHKRQRKILTPAFTSQRVGGLVPHFWKKGCELAEYLEGNASDVEDSEGRRRDNGFEVFNCLTRTTLDIIGLAGNPFMPHHIDLSLLDSIQTPFVILQISPLKLTCCLTSRHQLNLPFLYLHLHLPFRIFLSSSSFPYFHL